MQIDGVALFAYHQVFVIICMVAKGPFKYYVIKEVGGWGCQMMMFDDKVGRWGQLNDDVSKKYELSVSKIT